MPSKNLFKKTYIVNINNSFVGRENELSYLEKVKIQKEARILVVYGRRRTGKTELLEQSFRQRKLLKFEGLENKDESQQMQHFLNQLAKYVGDEMVAKLKYSNWCDLFEILYNYTSSGEVTIYLEEIQWMANYKENLIVDLKFAWDNYLKRNNKLILILCGSSPSFIINKIIKSKALHNRSLDRIHLTEFNVNEVRMFLDRRNLALQELMDIYLTVGGIPEYLKYIKKESSCYLAICNESFLKNGFFTDEYEKIFTSSLAKSENYIKIIEYLAKMKFATRDEILKHLKLNSGGSLSVLLEDLIECGFIEKIIPVGAKETTTLCHYAIRDAYLQFYFKFIKPLKSKIENNHYLRNPMSALPMDTYRKWLGFAFERWCRRNSFLIAKILGFSSIVYESGSLFKRDKSEDRESYQIDLIFKRADRVYTVCEIKYISSPIGVGVIGEVEKKIKNLKLEGKSIQRVLISANGADKSLQQKFYFDAIITLEDLFKYELQ